MIDSKVKLVVWDLDETFWKGTLSEGGVQKIEGNITIVQTLIDRGIMCSIVSKNESTDVEKVLREWGVWDYFIFPHISWLPKGEQVKHLLEQCSLRAENALFLDDNVSNLREVEYYNPHIMTASPDILDDEFLRNENLKGKNDVQHSRLSQYKVLELRSKEEQTYSSNEAFLRDSNIEISIISDCSKNRERICELIERTNQLNFTKLRQKQEQIDLIINDPSYSCACISVKDKFGDYGITGFYAKKGNVLEHFVFSCRTIGFGIENYLYKKLGYPHITIVEPVSTRLDKEYAEKIDWIHESGIIHFSEVERKPREGLLMIAGCDLEQACAYLDADFEVHKEFNTIVEGREIRTSDTSQLLNAVDLNDYEKQCLCDNLPFFEKGISFDSQIFSGRFNTIVISVVDDYIRGIWKNKQLGYEIGYGGYYDQDVFLSKLTSSEKNYLLSNFEFQGKENVNVFRNNLERIISLIGEKVHIVLINGIDLDVSEWIGHDRVERNREMNAIVDDIVKKYQNVELLDMRTIVTSKNLLPNKDNRHFSRRVYYEMANKLSQITHSYNELKVESYTMAEARSIMKRVVSRIKRR